MQQIDALLGETLAVEGGKQLVEPAETADGGCLARLAQALSERAGKHRFVANDVLPVLVGDIQPVVQRSRKCTVLLEGLERVPDVVAQLNPVLRGWGNYFRTGNASTKFQQVDRYVRDRIVRLLRRRGGQRAQRVPLEKWTWDRLTKLGLHRLIGTIRYPGKAHAS